MNENEKSYEFFFIKFDLDILFNYIILEKSFLNIYDLPFFFKLLKFSYIKIMINDMYLKMIFPKLCN